MYIIVALCMVHCYVHNHSTSLCTYMQASALSCTLDTFLCKWYIVMYMIVTENCCVHGSHGFVELYRTFFVLMVHLQCTRACFCILWSTCLYKLGQIQGTTRRATFRRCAPEVTPVLYGVVFGKYHSVWYKYFLIACVLCHQHVTQS